LTILSCGVYITLAKGYKKLQFRINLSISNIIILFVTKTERDYMSMDVWESELSSESSYIL